MRKVIAQRYAEAFLGYAQELIGRPQAVDELKSLKIILFTSPELKSFLHNPNIQVDEKMAVVDKALGVFSDELRTFLRLLLDKGRISRLIDICDYVRETYTNGETVEAVIKASYPMELEVVEAIKAKLENKFHKKLNLYLHLDSTFLGGLQVRVGNKIIDGSLKKRLDELSEQLRQVKV